MRAKAPSVLSSLGAFALGACSCQPAQPPAQKEKTEAPPPPHTTYFYVGNDPLSIGDKPRFGASTVALVYPQSCGQVNGVETNGFLKLTFVDAQGRTVTGYTEQAGTFMKEVMVGDPCPAAFDTRAQLDETAAAYRKLEAMTPK
ncbi:MAG: hypothetical protein DI551_04260 [Micavibrio aeruginosavorus]|uniref:Lipoprotein n=1 Tax=Micavibrio aeruginosavorus TaxID=349221 RepID=A0A2W5N3G6_9BACT|nr:MAG: hypothetical protein DI551_04260 [Micavibrio aeruginosavorus]